MRGSIEVDVRAIILRVPPRVILRRTRRRIWLVRERRSNNQAALVFVARSFASTLRMTIAEYWSVTEETAKCYRAAAVGSGLGGAGVAPFSNFSASRSISVRDNSKIRSLYSATAA